MKVVIVGTSNSVMRDGYIVGLRDSGVFEEIGSYSLGISTGVFSVLTTQGVDFSRYDFGIIDFAVNEQVFLNAGWTNLAEMTETFEALAGRMIEAGCVPVPLIIPRRSHLAPAPACDFYAALAQHAALPSFDVRTVIRRLQATGPFDIHAVYRDEAHMGPSFAHAVGMGLASRLKALQGRDFPRSERLLPQLVALDLAASAPDHLQRVEHATSLARQSFVRLTREPCTVGIPEGALVRGVAINISASDTVLKIEGEQTCLIDLRSNESGNRQRAFTFSVGYLPTPVLADKGCVRLSTVPISSLSDTETRELKAAIPSGPIDWDGECAEVAALILKLPAPLPATRGIPAGIAGDLATEIALEPFLAPR